MCLWLPLQDEIKLFKDVTTSRSQIVVWNNFDIYSLTEWTQVVSRKPNQIESRRRWSSKLFFVYSPLEGNWSVCTVANTAVCIRALRMKLTVIRLAPVCCCCWSIPSTEWWNSLFRTPPASNAITQLGPNKLLKIASNQGAVHSRGLRAAAATIGFCPCSYKGRKEVAYSSQ